MHTAAEKNTCDLWPKDGNRILTGISANTQTITRTYNTVKITVRHLQLYYILYNIETLIKTSVHRWQSSRQRRE